VEFLRLPAEEERCVAALQSQFGRLRRLR
jgi:hypothetical protein